MKNRQFILRLSLSIILLGYIVSRLDFGETLGVLKNFNPLFYAAGFACLLISQLSHAYLLRTLMGIHEKPPAVASAFKALAVGTFFGMFLPGSGGPDIMLAYNFSRNAKKKENPLSAIIFARVMILFAAIFISLILSFTLEDHLAGIRNIFIAAAAFIAIFGFLTLNRRCADISAGLFAFLKRNRWTHLLYRTYFVISGYREQKQLLLKILPLALLTSAFRITIDYFVARSLGLSIPAQYFFIFVPLISIAAVIPVSISGIGVREGTYVGLFSTVGVKTAEAFSISILAFSTGILFALIGAVIYITGGAALKPPEENADAAA